MKKKMKYNWSKKQEDEIIATAQGAALMFGFILGVIALLVMIWIAILYPLEAFIVFVSAGSFILAALAFSVGRIMHHRKKVASQDDNIVDPTPPGEEIDDIWDIKTNGVILSEGDILSGGWCVTAIGAPDKANRRQLYRKVKIDKE